MIPITIIVALTGIAWALSVSRATALGIVILCLLVYPEYLRIPIGPTNMSAPRLIALAILSRFLFVARPNGFRWQWVDTIVCLEWIWSVGANIIAGADSARMSEVIGRLFDSVLMYMLARVCLIGLLDCRRLVPVLTTTAVIAGSLGVFESITHASPYHAMQAHTAIRAFDFGGDRESRFGLLRAEGATSMPIYFGMAMFLLFGMIYSFRDFASSRWMWRIGCGCALAGALSSMSAGPQSGIVVFLIVVAFRHFTALIKPALVAFVLLLIYCETFSNRHCWYLIEYLNPIGGDFWYRSRLIDVALLRWRDYALFGVGSNIPNHWGALIDGRTFVDLVNEYVIVAVTGGVLSIACRVGIQMIALRDAVRAYGSGDARVQWQAYGEAATLIGFMAASLSVGLFGAPLILSYVFIGMVIRHPERVGVARSALVRRKRTLNAPVPIPKATSIA